MSTPMCKLCRQPDTDAHQASGYHKFNENLFSEGKMPISEANYNAFEAQRHQTGEQTSMSADSSNGHNVKGWHWQNKPMLRWFTPTLKNKVQDTCTLPFVGKDDSLVKLRVVEVSGDASLNNRKGKVTANFLVDIKLEIRVKIDDNTELKATAQAADIDSADVDDVTITAIKIETGANSQYKDAFQKMIKNNLQKLLIKAIEDTLKQMQHYAKNPQEEFDEPTAAVVDFDVVVNAE